MFAMGSGFFYTANAPSYDTLTITGTFPGGTVGTAYDEFVTISGGETPYTLTGGTGVASGSLPAGLSLSIENTDELHLSGTPTTAETADFTDSVDSADGQTATSAQTVAVSSSSSKWYTPLFAGGEQGMVFDFNDLSSLFQDAAATTPVTSAGQAIQAIRCQRTGALATIQGARTMTLDFDAGRNLYRGKIGVAATGNNAVLQAANAVPSSLGGDAALSLVAVAEFAKTEQGVPIYLGPEAPANGNAAALGNLVDPTLWLEFLQFGSGYGVQAGTPADGVGVAVGVKPAKSGGSATHKIYWQGALKNSNIVTKVANIATLNLDIGRVMASGRCIYAVAAIGRELTAAEVSTLSTAALSG